MTDDELIEAAARGDDGAFRLLVERWEQPVFAFLARMVGSREDARDLSQEVFVRVHARARRYESRGQFRSWLLRIAGNLARSWLRRRRIVSWLRFDPIRHDQASTWPGADAQIERTETRRAVQAAIARLPQRQRQALILRRYLELSHAEIARTLGTSRPGVESLLRRALTRLREDFIRTGLVPEHRAGTGSASAERGSGRGRPLTQRKKRKGGEAHESPR